MIQHLALALALSQSPANTLTDAERRDGWMLLFDGVSTKGWHNFKSNGIGPGWKVVDGTLMVADPSKAGDLVHEGSFDWFELKIDFNVTKGGNSGVMFRVTNSGEATWHTGPEVQIYDHPQQDGVETTGYLYQLYKPAKGVDASKPAGEWNTFHIRIGKQKCWTELNGVRLYEFVYGSEDFWARVAKSKFAKYPEFAKASSGAIALQGDHGIVNFRNIKIRRIE